MATIKELQAKFTSNASGMESAFAAMTNKLNDIEKASNRAANSMEKNMSRGMTKVFKTGEGFKKVSSSLENISKKSVELGNNLTKKITKPALAVGGALAGITIGKGFGRLVEIDNAKAKLEGLGHSGKNVKGIMDNALESVKGTSYGLGEAATTASSAVAAGIEPGKELTRYLSLTGDAAAIAGTSMGEMGSIINKVQTSNKAYNGELQQLSERGIPIYQWIAKEAGVTADAVFDMASDGKISSEMFLNAIETNIGGAAKKMGQKSFTAGLANMWAAVGRLGASFLDAGGKGGGFFSKMKPLMEELTNSLDGMETKAAKWGESLGKAFDKIVEGIRGIIGWYNSLDKNTQKLINSVMKWSALTLVAVGPILKIFGKLTGVIGAVFGPFGKFLQFIAKFSTATKSAEGAIVGITKVFPKLGWVIGTLAGPVGWVTLGIIALGTAFVVAYKKSETFRNIVNKVVEGVKIAFGTITEVIKGFFQLFQGNGQDGVITLSKILPPGVVQGLTKFADAVKENFFIVVGEVKKFAKEIGGRLLEFWNEMGPSIQEGIQKALPVIKDLGIMLGEIFKGVWTILKEVTGLIWNLTVTMMPLILGVIKNTWSAVKQIISGALDVILGIIKIFTSLFTMDIELLWSGIKQIFIGAFNIIVGLLRTSFIGQIIALVIMFSANIKQLFVNMWNSIWGTVRDVTSWIWNKVKTVWDLLKIKTLTTYTWIRDFLFNIWQGISTTVVNLVQGMGRGISRVFQSIWGTTQNIFGTLRGWLEFLWIRVRNFVVDRAYSMWTGTSNAFTGLWNSVLGIFGVLRDWVISTWQNIRNSVVNRATSLWRGVSGRFTNLWNSTQNIFNILREWLISTWQNIRNSVVNKAGSLWSGVSSRFWGLWDSVRNVTSTLRNWVIDTWDYIRSRVTSLAERVKDGVTSPFYKMRDIVQNVLNSTKGFIDDLTSKVKSGLNKVIDGMNKIGDFIGIDAKIPQLHTGTHSTHTQDFVTNGAINKDTMAVVGDKGKGNGPRGFRHEMIEDNKGNLSLTPDKDTVVPLKKGYKVHNGRSTHNFLSSMLGSNIPKFADGTFLGGIKKKKDDLFSMISGGMGKGMGKVTGKAAAAFEKAIGDIDDWMDKPKKLLEKMFDHFGVDQFKSVSGNIGDLTKGMFSRLKKGLIQQIKDWFEESQEGGDGDAAWLLSGKYPLLQEFGYYKGMTMNGTDRHWGLDFGMPEGTKIKALTDGKITQAGWVNGGGGNQVTLEEPGGKWFQWYMHMMNGGIKVKAGQKVKAGDLLGLSGNTGSSNTPHLHIQRMKGYPSNDTAVDPMDWLKSLGSGGGKKSSSKWRGEIQKAAKKMDVSLSSVELNDIASLINKESGGDPKIMQKIHDQNSGPNAARGLLQYTPGTFGSYATKAGKNILNGYHQLLAFFNNSNWRRDLSSWKSRMAMGITGWGPSGSNRGYATGGIVNSPQMAWLAEGGFSESVISHDPSMKARSKVLYDKTGDMLGFNQEEEILKEVLKVLMQSKNIQDASRRSQEQIARKDSNVYLDSKEITKKVNYRQGRMYRDAMYSRGLE